MGRIDRREIEFRTPSTGRTIIAMALAPLLLAAGITAFALTPQDNERKLRSQINRKLRATDWVQISPAQYSTANHSQGLLTGPDLVAAKNYRQALAEMYFEIKDSEPSADPIYGSVDAPKYPVPPTIIETYLSED